MVIRYEMHPENAAAAYWYRYRTSVMFRLGVLLAGLVPATLALAFVATAIPRPPTLALIAAVVVEGCSPYLFALLLRQLSRRGSRVLMIDAAGLTTEVASGQWQGKWVDVRQIIVIDDFVFLLGRGINAVSIPATAFADTAERDEFVRRARTYAGLA
jgi:hypothetical protein